MSWRLELALAIACAALSACGDEPVAPGPRPGPDAGGCAPGEATGTDGACIPAGVPPEACADGFVPEDFGCTPILPDACRPGTMAIPGETSCRAVAPCGEGTWGAIAIEPTTVYVDGSYAGALSDGTSAKPWKTIAEGVQAAAPGGQVVVAAGTYVGSLAISKPVRLVGRCPDRVEIVGLPDVSFAVAVMSEGVEIRGVAITGPRDGLGVSGGDVTVSETWIHDTGRLGAFAANVLGPALATFEGSLIEGTVDAGLAVEGVELRLERTVVRTAAVGSEKLTGAAVAALDATEPATVTVHASVLEGPGRYGLFVSGAAATLEGSVVRGMAAARGVVCTAGSDGAPSTLTLRASVVASSGELGLLVDGSVLDMESTVVRDTSPTSAIDTAAIAVQDNVERGLTSSARIRSSLIERASEIGLQVLGATADIESLRVRDGLQVNGLYGGGIAVQSGLAPSTLTLKSSIVERTYDIGVFVVDSTASVEGTLVSDTRAREADGAIGDGIGAWSRSLPASLSIAGSRVETSARAGIGNFAADVTLATTRLDCNAVDLDGENLGATFRFSDLGGNVCGCGDADVPCKALSIELEPPSPP